MDNYYLRESRGSIRRAIEHVLKAQENMERAGTPVWHKNAVNRILSGLINRNKELLRFLEADNGS